MAEPGPASPETQYHGICPNSLVFGSSDIKLNRGNKTHSEGLGLLKVKVVVSGYAIIPGMLFQQRQPQFLEHTLLYRAGEIVEKTTYFDFTICLYYYTCQVAD
jgi:hypothetical protein